MLFSLMVNVFTHCLITSLQLYLLERHQDCMISMYWFVYLHTSDSLEIHLTTFINYIYPVCYRIDLNGLQSLSISHSHLTFQNMSFFVLKLFLGTLHCRLCEYRSRCSEYMYSSTYHII